MIFVSPPGNREGVKIWRRQHAGHREEQEGVHRENGEVARGARRGAADRGTGPGLLRGETRPSGQLVRRRERKNEAGRGLSSTPQHAGRTP